MSTQEGFPFIEEEVDKYVNKPNKPKVGCEACPRNNVKGIQKIMGSINGKKLLIWAQSPGPDENKAGRELVGRTGRWWWTELERIGIERDDCDVQNVVRCFTADRTFDGWDMRDPTKEELKCCSVYNKEAIEQSPAEVWVILGKLAKDQLLGKKQQPAISFHKFGERTVKVYVLDHPAYFLRGAPKERLKQFRGLLDLLGAEFKEKRGRFSFLEDQDYKAVATVEQVRKAVKDILAIIKETGGRVSYDLEDDHVQIDVDGKIKAYDPNVPIDQQTRVALCVGVSPKPGMSRVFLLDHPDNPVSDKDKEYVRECLRRLIEHPHKKTMQHGNYDARGFFRFLNARIAGYDFDTQYGTYMRDSSHRSYSLSNIVDRELPQFASYKDIVKAAVPDGLTVEEGREIGEFHLSRVSLRDLVLYNGADADVTKRLELLSRDKVPLALVRVYTDAAFVTDDMTEFGPLLDYKYSDRLMLLYPQKKERHKLQLQRMADNPELNPNSPVQMSTLIFDQWKVRYPFPDDTKRSTEKEILELVQNSRHHSGVQALQDYREAKNYVERIEAFRRSADAHAGRVTTFWWLCMPAGELVLTNRGYLSVEQVNVGDLVITHKGRTRKVTNTVVNGVMPIVGVTLDNGLSLRTTPNHEYLVGNDWVCAADLKIGDSVIVHSGPEKWKYVKGWNHLYQISSWGRVFNEKTQCMMRLYPARFGHLIVTLASKTKVRQARVHRLVIQAFGSKRTALETRHINGCAWDNTDRNLIWGTRKQNAQDTIRHGTSHRNANITKLVIAEIRNAVWERHSARVYALRYGISPRAARDIYRGHWHTEDIDEAPIKFYTAKVLSVEVHSAAATYGLVVDEDASHVTGGILTHNTGARTGRLSSGGGTRPDKRNLGNLQNVPRNDTIKNMLVSDVYWREFVRFCLRGKETRINSEGKTITVLPNVERAIDEFADLAFFVANDFSQMELRILAQVTGDPEMIKVFQSGGDIHAEIGSIWTGWTVEELTNDEEKRALAKALHFGVVYGLSVPGLQQDLRAGGIKVSLSTVQRYQDKYFEKLKRVASYIKTQPDFAMEHGYVENLFGFRVPIDVSGGGSGGYWKNQSVNTPIQGAAHQVMLIALALIKRYPEKYSLLRPQMEVHDALYNVTPLKYLMETKTVVSQLLEKDAPETATAEFGVKWKIPFVADTKIGLRFGGLVKLKSSLPDTLTTMVLKTVEQEQTLLALEKKFS